MKAGRVKRGVTNEAIAKAAADAGMSVTTFKAARREADELASSTGRGRMATRPRTSVPTGC